MANGRFFMNLFLRSVRIASYSANGSERVKVVCFLMLIATIFSGELSRLAKSFTNFSRKHWVKGLTCL